MAPLMLRTSERKSFKTCRQQWYWSYVDHLEANRTKPALRFGDLVHQALAAYYIPGTKRGPLPALTFLKLYDAQIEAGQSEFGMRLEEEPDWIDARELGVAMLDHYIKRFGLDEKFKVIAPEMAFSVPILNKQGTSVLVVYVGQLDAVVQDRENQQVGLLEHKTAASISTAHLPLDEQAGSYWAFAPPFLREKGILKSGQDLDFILYNFLRKAKPDERPVNAQGHHLNNPTKEQLLEECRRLGITAGKSELVTALNEKLIAKGIDPLLLGSPSKSQPPPYFERQKVYRDEADRRNLLFRVRAEAWEMAQARAGKLPIYKNPSGTWPDQHCSGCEFRDMCELHETGSDWEELRKMTMRTWDPYEAHRITEEHDG